MRRSTAIILLVVLAIGLVVSDQVVSTLPRAQPDLRDTSAQLAAAPSPTPTIPQQSVQSFFPLGVFEDGNMIGGNTAKFEAMLKDLRAHNLDTVLFVNNTVARDEPLLGVADKLGFNIFMMPNGDLNETWWSDEAPATIALARSLAKPIVAAWGKHPSLKGYLVIDEPFLDATEKVALMTQALREADPQRPVLMNLIGLNRVGPIFAAAKPDVMQIDVYPAAKDNPPCDFTMNGFAYPQHDFVSYIRAATQTRPSTTPLWIILQTHSFDAGMHSLRTPLPTEVRMQQWLALGEGATGIYWFVYSTQQSWIGLADNKPLYDEVGALARRIRPLRGLLLGLHRVDDRFTVSGNGSPYISTLADASGAKTYVVVVNKDCQKAQNLTIRSAMVGGRLRDLESGRIYALGQTIPLQPGDGRIFASVDVMQLPLVRR
jgi:hypothetical protein